MSREVYRVQLDFDWPLGKVWEGYLPPPGMTEEETEAWYENDRCGPREGPGYQLWETVSEGSPMSPVFDSEEKLARWMSKNHTGVMGYQHTYEEALAFVKAGYSMASFVIGSNGELIDGVAAVSRFSR